MEQDEPKTITIPPSQATRRVLIHGVLVDWPEGEPQPGASPAADPAGHANSPDAPARQRDGAAVVAEGPAEPDNHAAEQE